MWAALRSTELPEREKERKREKEKETATVKVGSFSSPWDCLLVFPCLYIKTTLTLHDMLQFSFGFVAFSQAGSRYTNKCMTTGSFLSIVVDP